MSILPRDLTPKLLDTLREGYSLHAFGRDALAGIVVGIVALPLAIAFAIASGVRPEQGLFTAIIAGFLVSALGGSRVQIGGPTGAFVVIIAGIVATHGYGGLAVATMLAGILLIALGAARLGDVMRYVPYPVIVGFTSGIAIIIALGQVGDALGLHIDDLPAHTWPKIQAYLAHLREASTPAILICLGTIVVIQVWPRLNARIPGPLVALLVTTVIAQMMGLPLDTIGSRFGSIPSTLPSPSLPTFSWADVPALISPAISIALLGGIESLLSATVADGMIGGRHRPNAELIAQGVANIASPIFGGIPATGAIARTATNVRNGGRTPVAGIVHAVALLVILLVAGRWAELIPMATLAGILLVVAYNMSEWRSFIRLLRGPMSDILVLVVTFALTVAVDLVVAIQVGVVLAAMLFMRRMAEVSGVRRVFGTEDENGDAPAADQPALPAGLEVFEINGSFCFGAAQRFSETVLARQEHPRAVILRMRHVLAMDATGVHALETTFNQLHRHGTHVLISGIRAQPLAVLTQSGLLGRMGTDNVCATYELALERVQQLLAAPPA